MRHAQSSTVAPNDPGDLDLVRRALARDEAAVRAIMQSNNRRLYRLARGILRNDGEAEDDSTGDVLDRSRRRIRDISSCGGGGAWAGSNMPSSLPSNSKARLATLPS